MSFFSKFIKNITVAFTITAVVLLSSTPGKVSAYGVYTDANTGQVLTGQPLSASSSVSTGLGSTQKGSSGNNSEIVCFRWSKDFVDPAGCAASVAYIFLGFTSWFVYFAAIAFNASIDYGLNMANFLNDIPIVDIGWTTFRDLTSIFFVFIILYIAINTIIGNSSYGVKALLGKVIIGAILINFSLFFTKVIIDTSNIVALQFYAKMTLDAKVSSANAGNSGTRTGVDNPSNQWDSGISAQFADAMGLQTVWGTGADTGVSGEVKKMKLNAWNLAIVGFMGGIFMLVTATIFLAGAIMFIIRSLVFMFLMILAPLAFLGNILPSTKGHAKVWWTKLFNNAIFAPVYMILMYATLSMVLKPGGPKVNFIDMFRGDFNFSGTVLTFIVLNALMLGCLMVASKLGAEGAGWATGIASKATFGTMGAIGRNTIGRGVGLAADKFAQSSWSGNFAGRKVLGGLRNTANRTFDARGIGMLKPFGLGEAQKKGFSGNQDDKQKALEEYGKSLGKAGKAAFSKSADRATLKGLIGRRNKAAAATLKVEEIDEKVKDQKEKLGEFMNRDDVKEYKGLLREQAQDPLGMPAGKRARLATLRRALTAENEVKFLDGTGAEKTYNAAEVAEESSVKVRADTETFAKRKDPYKKSSKSKGLL